MRHSIAFAYELTSVHSIGFDYSWTDNGGHSSDESVSVAPTRFVHFKITQTFSFTLHKYVYLSAVRVWFCSSNQYKLNS